MNTTEIVGYIAENTQWQTETLIQFCQQNHVKIKIHNDLAVLDYIDDLRHEQWNVFNSSCRGLIIDLANKTVIAHAFNKFLSYNAHQNIFDNVEADVLITEKYDGSMIIGYHYQGKVCCSTRSSLSSEQSQEGHRILLEKYPQIADLFTSGNYSVIFEYISPNNKIHVDYTQEDLIVLAIRDLDTGNLVTQNILTELCQKYALHQAKVIHSTLEELVHLAKTGTFDSLEEGWIINYNNEFIKIKSWEYLVKLKLIRYGLTKKKLIDTFLSVHDTEIDKIFTACPELVKEDVKQFYQKFKQDLQQYENDIVALYDALPVMDSDKDFALFVRENHASLSKFLFSLRKGKSINKALKKDFPEIIDYYQHDSVTDIEKLQDWAFGYID